MMVNINLKMTIMKKLEFNNLVKQVREDLSVLPNEIPIVNKNLMEDRIKQKELVLSYDSATHINHELYEHFLKHRDLKWIWCHAPGRYDVDPKALYERAPDRCPVFGTLLDYGLGKNASANHPAFRPSMDHIEQQSRGGIKTEDINNFEIMSVQANTYRSNATLMQMLYLLKYELSK